MRAMRGFSDSRSHKPYCDGVSPCHPFLVAVPKLPFRGYPSGYRIGWSEAKLMKLPRGWSREALAEADRNGDFAGSHFEGDF